MKISAPGPRHAVPVLALAALLLSGCAGFAPAAREVLAAFDQPVRVESVAFYPQTELHCGPAALATMLDHSGVSIDYPDLVDRVYLPGRGGTLQVEILAAARSHNRIPWILPPEPAAVLAEVAAGRPVLVLENQGLRRLPYWHYAVIIGFDPLAGDLIQHSGAEEALTRPLRGWLRDWSLAGHWALITLRPEELPLAPEQARWFKVLADFEAVADPAAGLAAWQTAAQQWPDEALPWLGQGNSYYRLDKPDDAIAAFEQALALNPDQAAAAFNLAQVLMQTGRPCEAVAPLARLADHPALGQRARSGLAEARRACATTL